MIFNFSHKYQFQTRLHLNGSFLEQVGKKKLLGLTIRDYLSWKSNTLNAYKKQLFVSSLKKIIIPTLMLYSLLAFQPLNHVENICVLALRKNVCSLKQQKTCSRSMNTSKRQENLRNTMFLSLEQTDQQIQPSHIWLDCSTMSIIPNQIVV